MDLYDTKYVEVEPLKSRASIKNRVLSELRHVIRWAMGRELLEKTPFSRYGVRIRTKGEERRERRISPQEEGALLEAADRMTGDDHKGVGRQMKDRITGALETGCRKTEMLHIQNRDVDGDHHRILIRAENTKDSESRRIPFDPMGGLAAILKRRKFLGPEGFVFGDERGKPVKEFRTAFESLTLMANGVEPKREKKRGRVSRDELRRIDHPFVIGRR